MVKLIWTKKAVQLIFGDFFKKVSEFSKLVFNLLWIVYLVTQESVKQPTNKQTRVGVGQSCHFSCACGCRATQKGDNKEAEGKVGGGREGGGGGGRCVRALCASGDSKGMTRWGLQTHVS